MFSDKTLALKNYEELWKVELPLSFKGKPIKCKYNSEFFGFFLKDLSGKEDLYIYIYDINMSKFIGILNVSEIIGYN